MNRELSEILKEKRSEKDMSLREFSSFLGISHAYLSKLEKGVDPRTGKDIAPTIDTINKLSDGLNIPRNEFYNMCGYTNSGENIPIDNDISDIKQYFSHILAHLDGEQKFNFNGRQLKKSELIIIADAIEVGFTLALKRISNKELDL